MNVDTAQWAAFREQVDDQAARLSAAETHLAALGDLMRETVKAAGLSADGTHRGHGRDRRGLRLVHGEQS